MIESYFWGQLCSSSGCPVQLQTSPEAEKGWHLQEDAIDMCDNSENSGDTGRTSTILPPMGMITYLKYCCEC